jgi:hypothetical protein
MQCEKALDVTCIYFDAKLLFLPSVADGCTGPQRVMRTQV